MKLETCAHVENCRIPHKARCDKYGNVSKKYHSRTKTSLCESYVAKSLYEKINMEAKCELSEYNLCANF
mgnify:CR=1 FL=1